MTVSDQLLFHLYACPGEPARWPGVLDQICSATGARSAVVQRIERDRDGLTVVWSSADHASQAGQQTALASTDNPRISMHRIVRGLDRVVRDADLFDPEDDERALLQAQMAENGLGHFMGKMCTADDGAYLALVLHRAVDDSADFTAEQAACFASLAPHMGQAYELQLALVTQEQRRQRLYRHLDQLRVAMAVCDVEGRLQWSNRSAALLLETTPCIVQCGGQLRLTHRDNADRLRVLISDVAEGRRASAILTLGEAGQRLHVVLRAPPGPRPLRGCSEVLLVLSRAGASANISSDVIALLFGLSGAEARLAVGLVAGDTLEQYAARRGVGIGTVRGQVKQVFAKTGTTRQAELVALLLTSAAAYVLDSAGSVCDGRYSVLGA